MATSRRAAASKSSGSSRGTGRRFIDRYVNLVHSAALRQVHQPELAEEVAQSVFAELARQAHRLRPDSVLAAWLYQVTRRTAIDVVRRESRRQARERIATEMNATNAAAATDDWTHIEPILDEAMHALDEVDRAAVLLRYFENKSLRDVGQALGTSEDGAQKRVHRAVARLRGFFAKRGITVGASGLGLAISTHAVQAAPAGLATTISSALFSAAAHAGTFQITKSIAMTTMQKTMIAATITLAVGTGIYQAQRALHWQAEVQTLQQQLTPLTGQIRFLQQQRADAAKRLAAGQNENEQLRANTMELARLRGEVARLRADARDARVKEADLNAAEDPAAAEMKSWLSRVNQLKQHLDQAPNHKIPELRFVTEQDWLDAARNGLSTEADYRRALSAVRSAGERRFAQTMLQPALKQFMDTHDGRFPRDFGQLQPYFAGPVEEALLQRWEVAPAATVKSLGLGGDVIITQRAPVDDLYDTRFGIGPHGFGTTDFLSTLTRDAMTQVNQAYAAANNGKFSTDLSQLTPYATTPEQMAALQKLMERKGGK